MQATHTTAYPRLPGPATPRRPPPAHALLASPHPEIGIAVGAAVTIAVLVGGTRAGAWSLSTGELVVIALRLGAPLLIFRFWLTGGIIAMLLDAVDIIIIDFLGLGGFGEHYSQLDKLLDSYYYVVEAIVALRWQNPWMRIPAVVLFAYRILGAVLFETVGIRALLFVFPNLFENWWLYCVVVMTWVPALTPRGPKGVLIPLALLLIPKLGQEYLLHIMEAQPWNWAKANIFEPNGILLP